MTVSTEKLTVKKYLNRNVAINLNGRRTVTEDPLISFDLAKYQYIDKSVLLIVAGKNSLMNSSIFSLL